MVSQFNYIKENILTIAGIIKFNYKYKSIIYKKCTKYLNFTIVYVFK